VLCQDDSPNPEGRAVVLNAEFDTSKIDTGVYNYKYQTSNGISRQEESSASTNAKSEVILRVSGSYAYIAPDGNNYEVNYVADETGFYPVGTHFKTPKVSPWPSADSSSDSDDGSSNLAINLQQSEDSKVQVESAFLNTSSGGSVSTSQANADSQVLDAQFQIKTNESGSSSSQDVNNLYLPPPAPDADVINLLQYQNNVITRAIKEREAIYIAADANSDDPLLGSASQVVFYITKPRGLSMLSRSRPRGFSLQS
jgi:hypothetical protein